MPRNHVVTNQKATIDPTNMVMDIVENILEMEVKTKNVERKDIVNQ
jgi:hypothetical protein